MKKYQCMITGVGGQGSMMLGQFLKIAALKRKDLRVMGSESRGAAQREGSVDATVRYAEMGEGEEPDERRSVHSVSIPTGEADLFISMETGEILQALKYISSKTTVILNNYRILPRAAITQGLNYPELDDVIGVLKEMTSDIHVIDANKLSKDNFGDFTMVSVIFLGAAVASGKLPVSRQNVEDVINEVHRMPDRAMKAFNLGLNAMKQE
ncbi:MAG: 2-oxoacid:acceptor oxidoreductase family protein [Candidatus Hodarchaeota archaeon]